MSTFRVGHLTVEIKQDEFCESPREWDNVGTMACWHRRYALGDIQPEESPSAYLETLAREANSTFDQRFMRAEEILMGRVSSILENWIKNETTRVLKEQYIILPLYLYDHSGITMKTSPFSCPWDSGKVGFIYCSLKKAQEEFGTSDSKVKGWEGKSSCPPREDGTVLTLREAAIRYLELEVKVYDQYLRGDVYCYSISDGETELESCGGFYGEDYAEKEARTRAEEIISEKKRMEQKESRESFHWACRDTVTV